MTSLRALGLAFVTISAACSLLPRDPPSDTPLPASSSTTSSGAGGTPQGTGGAGGAPTFACDTAFADMGTTSDAAKAVWSRPLPGRLAGPARATLDGAGNILVSDEYRQPIDFGGGVTLPEPPAYFSGQYIAKLAPSGEALWASRAPDLIITRLEAGESGSFWTQSMDGKEGTTKVRRWDPSGAVLWTQTIPSTGVFAQGLVPAEGDRVFALFGMLDTELDYGTGKIAKTPGAETDMAALEYDASGNVVWARSLGEVLWPTAPSVPWKLDIEATARAPGGGAFVLLTTEVASESAPKRDRALVLLRLTAGGDVMWIRRFPAASRHVPIRLAAGPEGQTLIHVSLFETDESADFGCGVFNGRGFALAKIAPDGTPEWTRTFAGEGILLRSSFDPKGDIVLGGLVGSPCDLGGGDVVPPSDVEYNFRYAVAKLGPDGAHRRSGVVGEIAAFVGEQNDFVLVDHEGNLVLGSNQSSLDLGLGPLPTEPSLFVAKIAP